MAGYTGGEAQLKSFASTLSNASSDHLAHLQAAKGVAQVFATALQSQGIGTAVQQAMDNADRAGQKLHQTLEEIHQTLHAAGSAYGGKDQEIQSDIQKVGNM